MERPDRTDVSVFGIKLGGERHRSGIDRLNRIELRPGLVIGCDAIEICLHELRTGELASAHCGMDAIDRGLEHMETGPRLRRRALRGRMLHVREQQRDCAKQACYSFHSLLSVLIVAPTHCSHPRC